MQGGSCTEICLFLRKYQGAPFAGGFSPPKGSGGTPRCPVSPFTVIGRLGSCLGGKESFTGLLWERTVGVCHLIHPPIQGQLLSRTNKQQPWQQEPPTPPRPGGRAREQRGTCRSCPCIWLSHQPLFVFPPSCFHQCLEAETRELVPTQEPWVFHNQSQSDNILLSGSEARFSVSGPMPKVGLRSPNYWSKNTGHTHVDPCEQCQTQRHDARRHGILDGLGNARVSFIPWAPGVPLPPKFWVLRPAPPHTASAWSWSLALRLSLVLRFLPFSHNSSSTVIMTAAPCC